MQGVIPLLVEGHELVPLGVHVVVVELRGQLLLQEARAIQKLLYVSVQALAAVLVPQSWWNFFLSESGDEEGNILNLDIQGFETLLIVYIKKLAVKHEGEVCGT